MKKILICFAVLAILGTGCNPIGQTKVTRDNSSEGTANKAETSQLNPAVSSTNLPETTGDDQRNAQAKADVADSYLSSNFRVIKILKNPHSHSFLVLATERDNNTNDSTCGSIYSAPTCYFFVEPDYYSDAPLTHLAAKLEKSGGLDYDTPITFTDADHIRFTTIEGDAGYGLERTWEVNLTSSTSTMIGSKEIGGEKP
jgi:hypothetical protein